DRRDDAPRERDGMERDGILRQIGAEYCQHLAGPQAAVGEAGSRTSNGVRPRSIRQRASGRPIDERGLVAVTRRALEEERGERDGGNRAGTVGTAKNHRMNRRILTPFHQIRAGVITASRRPPWIVASSSPRRPCSP